MNHHAPPTGSAFALLGGDRHRHARLARRAVVGAEAGSVAGQDHRGDGQQEVPADVRGVGVRAERIVGGAVGSPPGVGADEHVVRRGGHRGNVLGGISGVRSNRTEGASSAPSASRSIHRSPAYTAQ